MTISLGQSQTPAGGPTIPPARNAWDVLSQYGSTYTNQPGVDFNSFGGSNILHKISSGFFLWKTWKAKDVESKNNKNFIHVSLMLLSPG